MDVTYHHTIENRTEDGSVNMKGIRRDEICFVSYNGNVTATFKDGVKLPLAISPTDAKEMRDYFTIKGFIDLPGAQMRRDAIRYWECNYKEDDDDTSARLYILALSGDEFTFIGKQARDIYKAIVREF